MKMISRLVGRRLVAVTVRGSSMEPTYADGDRVLVRRGVRPVPGRVVVVEHLMADGRWLDPPARSVTAVLQRNWMIKRVAATPGDPVPPGSVPHAATEVPPGRLVLLGDNPLASLDSRKAGFFPVERVLGAVLCRLNG